MITRATIRLAALSAFLLLSGLISMASFYTEAESVTGHNDELTIDFVDVGQGDGAILHLPGGRFVVIDANVGAAPKMSILLDAAGCTEIFAMVMSHPHQDHIGALPELLERYPVRRFYDPGYPQTTKIYRRVLEAVERNGSDYIMPAPGDTLDWDTRLSVTVLHSGAEKNSGANNASIVLRIVHDSVAIIFTGDAEREAEERILKSRSGSITASILKVGHHGSLSSSTPGFLDAIAPKDAIISCGTGNSYRHPRQNTLDELNRRGARIYRTDLNGLIRLVSTGDSYAIEVRRTASIKTTLTGADVEP